MRFVHDREIAALITNALGDAEVVKLAVAFWGKNAECLVGLDAFRGRAKIVCDAFSGACNPDTLASLIKHHDVRFVSGLHAKVYWTQRSAVVGSANASVNGLRGEGGQLRYEAAIQTDDPGLIASIETWIDAIFEVGEVLDEKMIEQIRPLWDKVQNDRLTHGTDERSLVRVLQQAPDGLVNKRIFVLVQQYGESSKEARATYDVLKGKLFAPEDIRRYSDEGMDPFYEDEEGSEWDVRPNDVYLDFWRGPRGGLGYGGMWQVRNNNWEHAKEGGGRIVLLDEIELFENLALDGSDARIVMKALKRLVAKHRDEYVEKGYLQRSLTDLTEYLKG